jgi:hypothetical protein
MRIVRCKLILREIISMASLVVVILSACSTTSDDNLKNEFKDPPDSARPGVYWYFMDGNLSAEGMTKDLESMKKAGIGNVLFLEVNVGVPRGKVDFLSDEWQELYRHLVSEAERLGIEVTLGSGPGWAGSGGPWVKPEQSMRHLVASSVSVSGPAEYNGQLPKPDPKRPYFGEGALTQSLKKLWDDYYEDVFVLAFPTPDSEGKIAEADEKALYYRAPYTSREGVKPWLPAPAVFDEMPGSAVDINRIVDLTDKMDSEGRLKWDVPEGKWTIMRFGVRNNGAVTRPAPMPGLGFECDKFDTAAFNFHFDQYIGKLLDKVVLKNSPVGKGWTMIHIDSWEMGAQNWSDNFREEFKKRRGYDPLKFFPAYAGMIVGSLELSERFLWDVRQTSMELVLENHAGHFKDLGRRYGFTLSIEPYDMNPTADLDLGAVANVPMCEFWTKGYGFNSSFSCIEATSIAHVLGRSVVAAEAFTAGHDEAWKMYPGNVKNQGDWAFCMGINKFVYHTFAHQPLDDKLKPGMTMGPYGVHWDRGQTWWYMAPAYHKYVSRCQNILRQGKAVADILYLTPEGAPHVFRPPSSALSGDEVLPDKRGYNFDGCSPRMLIEKAGVKDNRIVFPGGTSYSVLVLPDFKTMTPKFLEKIEELLREGAYVLGNPPLKSQGLVDFPYCDERVASLANQIWKTNEIPEEEKEIQYGKGRLFWGGNYSKTDSAGLYPEYETVAELLTEMGVEEDFISSTGSLRYTHRTTPGREIYFVSNSTDKKITDTCTFRVESGIPELWDPVTGETRILGEYFRENGKTTVIPLQFDKAQSFFIVFDKTVKSLFNEGLNSSNFPVIKEKIAIKGSWEVSFNPDWGGPEKIIFDSLTDWSLHPDEGIRYYSGTAKYHKSFNLPDSFPYNKDSRICLDLGEVKNIAVVRLNGKDMGVAWTYPWRVDITEVVKKDDNNLEIEVVNLWVNRLIGDEKFPYDGVKDGKWPQWLLEGKPRPTDRYTFVPLRFYDENSPLQSSGLLGPVEIVEMDD